MTKNEIVRRLREAGINASSTDRSASAYIQDATGIRATAGWFGFRITCDTQATERRVRMVLERYYEVEISGGVWRLRTKRRLSVMASGGLFPPAPPTPTKSPMYLEAAEANSTVSMGSNLETAPNLEYSTDGINWQPWEYTTAEGTHTFDTITLGAIGDKVYFRGDNPDGLANFDSGWNSTYVLTGTINAGGNVMSLLDSTMESTEVPDNGLTMLFFSVDETPHPLLTAPDMSLITAIGYEGCASMYSGCTSLTSAAAMPALTTIGEGGCDEMYYGCTSLTSAAAMPALTSIGEGGCNGMYFGCTSLTSAADMPALTSIGAAGCTEMYSGCTSLTSAADMPALTSIGEGGCTDMYNGCTSLTAAAAMPALTSIGEGGCNGMYFGCTSLTAAADMLALTTIGNNGCVSMYYGCTSLTAAADMPSLTTIGNDGCDSMYYGCTFNMSDDGETLNFAFPTPPITTTGGTTYSTAYDIAQWMGNTNGF